MIDTHTHLYLPEFSDDGDDGAAVRRALAAGVRRMIFPNVDLSTIEPMERLAAQFPGKVFCAMGLHPTEVGDNHESDLDVVARRLAAGSYVAVGEVGVDLYWSRERRDDQLQAFDRQMAMAADCGLPVIIHCREALPEVLEVLGGHPGVPAVFHSFGGSVADVEAIRRRGDYYFGINGIVTFKNSRLADVLPAIGLERLLLETDSPYLAPVPYRGRRNESAYLPAVAARVAAALDTTADVVDAVTSASATAFFGLDDAKF